MLKQSLPLYFSLVFIGLTLTMTLTVSVFDGADFDIILYFMDLYINL